MSVSRKSNNGLQNSISEIKLSNSRYASIIDLSHFHDPERPFMSRSARAAQFMPFKALSGFEDEVEKEVKGLEESFDDMYCDLEEGL